MPAIKALLTVATLACGLATIANAEGTHAHADHAHGSSLDSAELEGLRIETPLIRATPPNAPAAGGFVKITNTTDKDDWLVGASIAETTARKVEIHTMEMDGDVMRMMKLEDGLMIPAGKTVQLAPGGLHLMIMGLSEGLKDGGHHDITLSFLYAGDVTLDFAVMDLAEVRALTKVDEAAAEGHEGHDHEGHDHDDHDDHKGDDHKDHDDHSGHKH